MERDEIMGVVTPEMLLLHRIFYPTNKHYTIRNKMTAKMMAGKLNDQKPKPRLGNDPNLHGKTSVDNAGGANPPAINPSKKKK